VENFITRYNKESLHIKGAGEDLRISDFIQGVRDDGLVREIHRDGVPDTVEAIMDIAKAWVRLENACNLMNEIDSRRNGRRDDSQFQGKRKRGTVGRSHQGLINLGYISPYLTTPGCNIITAREKAVAAMGGRRLRHYPLYPKHQARFWQQKTWPWINLPLLN
jgi:hypothetical protein